MFVSQTNKYMTQNYDYCFFVQTKEVIMNEM